MNNKGEFRLIDASRNVVVLGADYDVGLDEIERWLKDIAVNETEDPIDVIDALQVAIAEDRAARAALPAAPRGRAKIGTMKAKLAKVIAALNRQTASNKL